MKKYWLTSGVYSLLSNSVMLVFAFISFLILVRVLPQEQFGVWVLYLTVINFAEILRTGMTQSGLIKFIAENDQQDQRDIITAALIINICCGVFGFLLIMLLAMPLSHIWAVPQLQLLLYLYGVYLLFFMPLTFIEYLCIANMDFKSRFLSKASYHFSYFLLIGSSALIYKQIHIYYLPLLQSLAALVALIIAIAVGGRYFKIKTRICWKWIGILFHYGKYVFATSFSSMLTNRTDLLMIGYFLTPIAVAIYNIPTRIGNYVEVPMNSISAIVFPQAAQRNKEQGKDAVRYLYERSVGAMLVLIIPAAILMFVFAQPIILLVAGETYLDAVPILRLFAIVSLIKPFGRQGGMILDSIGKPNYNFYQLVLTFAINFILNWIFIRQFGLIGAIIATLIAFATGTFILMLKLRRMIFIKFHHPFIYLWKFYKDIFHQIIITGTKIMRRLQHVDSH